MNDHQSTNPSPDMTGSPRHFLAQNAFNLSSVALAWRMQQDGLLAAPPKPALERPTYDLLPKPPQKQAQATAMISLFMQGGPSHHDLFDPKPELKKHHMKDYVGDFKYGSVANATTKLFAGPWEFSPHGECGMELSELIPCLGTVADDICLIRSMHTGVDNHLQSVNALNTGRIATGRPSLGSWMTYGLGTESQELPAFVV